MRTYHGHRFRLQIPEAWEDRSRPFLLGPPLAGDRAGLAVQIEAKCKAPNAERYAQEKIEGLIATVPGWDPLRQEALPGPGAPEAVLVELRSPGPAAQRQYRRFYFRVMGGTGFCFVVQMGRPSRRRMSRALDQMVLSAAPPGDERDRERTDAGRADAQRTDAGRADAGRPDADRPDAGRPNALAPASAPVFRSGRFTMRLYPGWEDATAYEWGLPRTAGGVRNLFLRRERWGAAHAGMPDLAAQAEIETRILRERVPGFELVAEDECELDDGRQVPRVRFRRQGSGGLALEQRLMLAADADELFFLCLTSEADPGEDVAGAYDRIHASFVIEPAGEPAFA